MPNVPKILCSFPVKIIYIIYCVAKQVFLMRHLKYVTYPEKLSFMYNMQKMHGLLFTDLDFITGNSNTFG